MAEAVDVALLDCILPGETMWQIVLEADRQDVPVVLMTGDPAQMKAPKARAQPYLYSSHSAWLRRNGFWKTRRSGPLNGDTPVFVGRSAILSEPDPPRLH